MWLYYSKLSIKQFTMFEKNTFLWQHHCKLFFWSRKKCFLIFAEFSPFSFMWEDKTFIFVFFNEILVIAQNKYTSIVCIIPRNVPSTSTEFIIFYICTLCTVQMWMHSLFLIYAHYEPCRCKCNRLQGYHSQRIFICIISIQFDVKVHFNLIRIVPSTSTIFLSM